MITRFKIFFLLTTVILFLFLTAFETGYEKTFNEKYSDYFNGHLKKAVAKLDALNSEMSIGYRVSGIGYQVSGNGKAERNKAEILLREAREEYKAIEAFVIYFMPSDARLLNRTIIPEMEKDERISPMIPPHGYQYLEKLIFSDSIDFHSEIIKGEIGEMKRVLEKVHASMNNFNIDYQSLCEAIHLQIVRQFMLGLVDFETPQSKNGIKESELMVTYIQDFINQVFGHIGRNQDDLIARFNSAAENASAFLTSMGLSDRKDYYTFYSGYYIPLSKCYVDLHESLVASVRSQSTPINFKAPSIFSPEAFNSFFFMPAKKQEKNNKVAELGKTLFFDPVLSDNNLRACASCHRPEKAFTDGLTRSLNFDQETNLPRNAPTIINSIFQKNLFYDGRSDSYENQALKVLINPKEMHHNINLVADKLKKSPGYVDWFRSAFSGTRDTTIDRQSVLTAIAEYERTLVGMNSRFDLAMNGDNSKINNEEREGFNVFVGKGNCASCHFLPLFNGLMPVEYMETEWEIIGVPEITGGIKKLDPDSGRGSIVPAGILRHAFKAPSVRNAELTGPYMHNGVFKTLEEVVDFYDVGGGIGLGFDVPYQTLSPDSLHLNETEKHQLVSFLKSLTDTINLTSHPSHLPEFPEEPELNARAIGGKY